MAHKEEHPLLQKPLYVFDLPTEILDTLTPKAEGAAAPPTVDDAARPSTVSRGSRESKRGDEEDGADKAAASPATATSCGLCNLTFASLAEQRGHVRSDLHGYNLKQKMRGANPVSEAEFEKLVGELDESISGSESSESDEEEGEEGFGGAEGGRKETTLSALLKRQAKIADADGAEEVVQRRRKRGGGKPPLLWFTSDKLPGDVNLGVYRAILSDAEQDDETNLVETIRKKQLAPVTVGAKKAEQQEEDGGVKLPAPPEIGPHYFLCMIGGGHFAAMIVALAPKMGKKHTGADERQATVVAHKTFHRYTTRRKQGGSQSASDASKGAAHSAGSSLRRYNETALTSEVRALLTEWKEMIDTADLLFIRATGSTNRRTLFGPYEGQVLRHNDDRLRGFPFSTRRATQAELMRSFIELTRVKVSRIDEAALAAAAEAAAAQQQAPTSRASTPSKPAKPPKPTPEEEEALLHTSQLQALIRRSKAPALVSYIQSNGLSPNFRFHPLDTEKNYHAPTPLHLAAHMNAPAVVLALLTRAKADPTVTNLDGKTPFELAGDRATRDAFRIARYELGDAAFDWGAAHVPAGVSRAEVEKSASAEKQEEAAKEAERRKQETERLRREEEQREAEKRERRVGKGKALGAGLTEKTAGEKREEEARGLTPEMRMRLERERRARAAEERIRRMQQGN